MPKLDATLEEIRDEDELYHAFESIVPDRNRPDVIYVDGLPLSGSRCPYESRNYGSMGD